MLVSDRYVWRVLLRDYWHIPALQLALDSAVAFAYLYLGWNWITISTVPLTIVGAALSIMLGFRSNEAYSRYNEARTLWGTVVNACRSYGRQVTALLPHDAADASPELARSQRRQVLRIIGYAHALRASLWGEDAIAAARPFLEPDETERLRGHQNVPAALLHNAACELRECTLNGWVHDFHLSLLHDTIRQLNDAQGGCERIKNTPIPRTYAALAHRIVLGYSLALPFGLVRDLAWLMPAVSTGIAFTFSMLDRFASNIEDPFCQFPTALPLLSITRTIEINLKQQLGESDVPEPVQPVGGILS